MSCRRPDVPKIIDQLFVGEAGKDQWGQIRDHLHACDACRAYYNRVMHLASQLQPETSPLSSLSMEGVVDAVVGTPGKQKKCRRDGFWFYAVPAGAVFGLAMALLFIMPGGTSDEFQARGSGASAQAGVGLRVACVHIDEHGTQTIQASLSSLQGDVGHGLCRLQHRMKLFYTNQGANTRPYRFGFFVGVDETGSILWYYPTPGEAQSIPLAGGADIVDHPLAGTIRLGVNHRPGRIQVLGVFSQAPLSVPDVERSLRASTDAKAAMERLLPAAGGAAGDVVELMLEITE